MDAIIIADAASESVSATNTTEADYRWACDIDHQTVKNFLDNHGRVVHPIRLERGVSSWGSSLKLNGLYLYSYLSGQGFDVQLVDSYFEEKENFIEMLKQSPKAVVISTTFIISKKTLEYLVRDIRTVAPGIFNIAGGQLYISQVEIRERQKSDNPIMDIFGNDCLFLDERTNLRGSLYISSSGEEILSQALTMLRKKGKVEGLPNTDHLPKEEVLHRQQSRGQGKSGRYHRGLEEMPEKFFCSGVVPLQASYGCPYNCAFCNL